MNKILDLINTTVSDHDFIAILSEVSKTFYEFLLARCSDRFNISPWLIRGQEHRKSFFHTIILAKKTISLSEPTCIEQSVVPERTIGIAATYQGKKIRVLGLHVVPGSSEGRTYERGAKAKEFRSFTQEIIDFRPDIIGIDANEPEFDAQAVTDMAFWSNWDGNTYNDHAARAFFVAVENNGLLDHFRINFGTTKPSPNPLAQSIFIGGKSRRYDHLFIRKSLLNIAKQQYMTLENVSDHAAVVAID